MLPRTLPQSLRRSLQNLVIAQATCDVCVGRCGAQSLAQPFSTSAPRTGIAKAPSTRVTSSRNKARGLTPEQARKIQEAKDKDRATNNAERAIRIRDAHDSGHFGQTPAQVNEFIESFAVLSKDVRSRIGAETCATFRKLVDAAGMSEQDLMFLAIMLLQNNGVEDDKYWGRKLLDISAAAGYTEASIRLVNGALVQARSVPGVLRQASVSTERGRLQKIAREGTHSRAMVLEGKVAYHLGDFDTAIKWWWQAMEKAVAKSELDAARRVAGIRPTVEISAADRDDLLSPWIELIQAHYDRSIKGMDEWHLFEKALKIGIQQDDPTAFYYAATYYMERDETGQHVPTSKWLHYMTKAAASGVPKAACDLAAFYHESGWKYIEDEPPDHVKPTPFDSYPPTETTIKSTWKRVRQFLWPIEADKGKEEENIFHTAAWPPTPSQRHELALMWLNSAIIRTYAPALLQAAKIHLEETLWAGAKAPEEALNLSPKRYLYASEAEKRDADFSGDIRKYEMPADAQDQPSAGYRPELAKTALKGVLNARVAVFRREATLKATARSRPDLEWEDFRIEKDELGSEAVFYQNADVYDMWAKDSRAMYQEALAICERMGWTLVTEEMLARSPWLAEL